MTDDDVVVLVCMRTADVASDPIHRAYRDHCSTCGAEVWRSERSRGVKVDRVVCVPDALAEPVEQDEVQAMAPWVEADLHDTLAELRRRSLS